MVIATFSGQNSDFYFHYSEFVTNCQSFFDSLKQFDSFWHLNSHSKDSLWDNQILTRSEKYINNND